MEPPPARGPPFHPLPHPPTEVPLLVGFQYIQNGKTTPLFGGVRAIHLYPLVGGEAYLLHNDPLGWVSRFPFRHREGFPTFGAIQIPIFAPENIDLTIVAFHRVDSVSCVGWLYFHYSMESEKSKGKNSPEIEGLQPQPMGGTRGTLAGGIEPLNIARETVANEFGIPLLLGAHTPTIGARLMAWNQPPIGILPSGGIGTHHHYVGVVTIMPHQRGTDILHPNGGTVENRIQLQPVKVNIESDSRHCIAPF